MAVTTTCKGCNVEISAETEDELVARVLEHLAEAHPGHKPSPEQVRAVIRARQKKRP